MHKMEGAMGFANLLFSLHNGVFGWGFGPSLSCLIPGTQKEVDIWGLGGMGWSICMKDFGEGQNSIFASEMGSRSFMTTKDVPTKKKGHVFGFYWLAAMGEGLIDTK